MSGGAAPHEPVGEPAGEGGGGEGSGALQDVVGAVLDLLDGRCVATAESCTGGRLAAVFADAPGASTWYRGGVVPYQEELKRRLLGVRAPSVYCEAAAGEMASGVADLFDAEVSVATSGVAGDEPVDGAQPGTVFVATRVGAALRTRTYRFAGPATAVCDAARSAALHQLRAHLADVAVARR